MKRVKVKFMSIQEGGGGHKINFSLVPGFSVLSRRIARWVSSLIWVVLGEKLAVVRKLSAGRRRFHS